VFLQAVDGGLDLVDGGGRRPLTSKTIPGVGLGGARRLGHQDRAGCVGKKIGGRYRRLLHVTPYFRAYLKDNGVDYSK